MEFTYHNVHVKRIIDGDTIECIVDLGFNVSIKQIFRLDRIDTAETYRPINEAERAHGLEATKFLKELILGKTITVISNKKGKYGRYLADIFYNDINVQDLMFANNLQKRDNY